MKVIYLNNGETKSISQEEANMIANGLAEKEPIKWFIITRGGDLDYLINTNEIASIE